MSEGNVEVVRRAADAFSRLDFEGWKAATDERIKLYPRPEEPGVEPCYEGMEGVLAYMANWYSGWDEYTTEPVRFIDASDYVVVEVREVGIAKGTGIRIEENFAHAFKVTDGKIVEWRMFGPVDEALAAIADG